MSAGTNRQLDRVYCRSCTWGGAAIQLREPVQSKEAVAVRWRAVVPAADEYAALRRQEPQLPHGPVAGLQRGPYGES